jgi:hypothetical protein
VLDFEEFARAVLLEPPQVQECELRGAVVIDDDSGRARDFPILGTALAAE